MTCLKKQQFTISVTDKKNSYMSVQLGLSFKFQKTSPFFNMRVKFAPSVCNIVFNFLYKLNKRHVCSEVNILFCTATDINKSLTEKNKKVGKT